MGINKRNILPNARGDFKLDTEEKKREIFLRDTKTSKKKAMILLQLDP